MPSTSSILRKLALLLRRNRFRSELDEEMAFHRANAEQEFLANGLSPEAARRAASIDPMLALRAE